MEKYTEYRVLMLVGGKWKTGTHWHGGAISKYRDKDSCVKALLYVIEEWKQHALNRPMPEEWKIQYREVVTTDWLEYI